MDSQQETRDEKPLTFADIGIPTGPKLEEGALGKVRYYILYSHFLLKSVQKLQC